MNPSIFVEGIINARIIAILSAGMILLAGLVACTGAGTPVSVPAEAAGKPVVVATTSTVADVVRQVAGDKVEVVSLLPLGADPHGFEPSPQDIALVADAELIFANGAGLEEFLAGLIESSGGQDKVVYVSEGITLIDCGEGSDLEHEDENQEGHPQQGLDPHTWVDPNNVKVWTQNIEGALGALDPENENAYRAHGERYRAELDALDAWIREQVSQLPEGNRKIVSDHAQFCYFIDEYGLEQAGAVVPGYSTSAEPSAQELAALEDAVKDLEINAIFVGNTVNPKLAERVAEDTGTQLIFIYTGSLSEPGGEAGTYLDYMRFNVRAFIEGLK